MVRVRKTLLPAKNPRAGKRLVQVGCSDDDAKKLEALRRTHGDRSWSAVLLRLLRSA